MTIVSRAQWGARAPRRRTRIPGPVAGVAVHYEGVTIGNYNHSTCDDRVRAIQSFHMDRQGWDDVAYSFLVCRHGTVYEGRGPGVRTAANGTNDGNGRYYAGCIIMGPGDELTNEAKMGWLEGREWLQRHGAGGEVRPHSDFLSTGCPGDACRSWVHGLTVAMPGAPQRASRSDSSVIDNYYSVEETVADMPVIRQGNSSQHARILQGLLVANGRQVAIDGDFGPRTAAALREWQEACGLDDDAVAGPGTWRRLLCV